ncbi:MAG: hypothetical protein JO157_05905 [Acetobacteraceae bacterium]|nr:hypothetical protein [Acetobacteraceae bacterium]
MSYSRTLFGSCGGPAFALGGLGLRRRFEREQIRAALVQPGHLDRAVQAGTALLDAVDAGDGESGGPSNVLDGEAEAAPGFAWRFRLGAWMALGEAAFDSPQAA